MRRWLISGVACLLIWPAAVKADDVSAAAPFNPFSVRVVSLLGSDYIDRGQTVSAHRPSAGNTLEVQHASGVYVRGEVNTVKLPSNPIAEINMGGGYRRSFGSFRIDINSEYSHYPRETLNGKPTDTDYWEHTFNAYYNITPEIELAGQFSWAPDMAKTGAWSKYTEFVAKVELPKKFTPAGVIAEFSAGVGYYWFGRVLPATGNYRLPAYTYWHAGVEFFADPFRLDFRYHDTGISRENCFILTGDPGATPGGFIDEVSNPRGLRSNWCGATFVTTLSIEFDSSRSKGTMLH